MRTTSDRGRCFRWAAMALLFGAARVASAPDEGSAKALPPDLDLVARSAIGFVTVRGADLWNSPYLNKVREVAGKEGRDLPELLEAELGVGPTQIERLTVFLSRDQEGGEPLVLVRTSKPYDPVKVKAAVPEAQERKVKDKPIYVNPTSRKAIAPLGKRTYLLGSRDDVKRFLMRPEGKKDGSLEPALLLAAGKHLVVAGLSGPRLAALVEKSGEKLPRELVPFQPLLKARPLALTADIGAGLRVAVTLTFAQEEDSRAGEKAAREGLALARQALAELMKAVSSGKDHPLFSPMAAGLKEARIERRGATVRVDAVAKFNSAKLADFLVEARNRALKAANRNTSMNNLKQIGLAFHNYYDQRKRFPPPAIYSKEGKPLLSWRVAILPYLGDEEDKLYQQFKLDEPWDSAHNKKLLTKVPKVYLVPLPGKAGPGETFYQGFVGKSAFFELKKGNTVTDIPDGWSKTIIVVEAAKPVPWTKPEDIPFDPSKPVPQLGGVFPDGFHALFADGHVFFFRRDVKLEDLKFLITRNAGDLNVKGIDF